jgi:hypothetical protein
LGLFAQGAPLFIRCYFNETQTSVETPTLALWRICLKIIGRLGSGGVAVGSIPRRAEGPLGRRITVRQPSREPRQDMRLRTVGTPHLHDDLRKAGIADGVNVDARGHGVAGSGALETQLAHSFVSGSPMWRPKAMRQQPTISGWLRPRYDLEASNSGGLAMLLAMWLLSHTTSNRLGRRGWGKPSILQCADAITGQKFH